VFLASTGNSQSFKNNQNYFDFHKKSYYFGISLGLNSSRFNLIHSKQFIGNDSINVAEGANGPGFNVHIIGNLKIGDYFDFRILPGFSFVERDLEYKSPLTDSGLTRRRIESVFFEMPFHLRYKSAPYKDKRVFVVGGLKYSYDVSNNSKTRQADSLVKISPHDFQLEVGAGVQFFFPYFIFSPEIKYSQGIGNILIYNGDLNEASVLEKILSRVLTISFHFEG
jgi:hypothetical protein